MARKLTVGDKVQCRLYNTPEGRFYGKPWTGTVLEIDPENKVGETIRPYLVSREPFDMWLTRKEILRRVKNE